MPSLPAPTSLAEANGHIDALLAQGDGHAIAQYLNQHGPTLDELEDAAADAAEDAELDDWPDDQDWTDNPDQDHHPHGPAG